MQVLLEVTLLILSALRSHNIYMHRVHVHTSRSRCRCRIGLQTTAVLHLVCLDLKSCATFRLVLRRASDRGLAIFNQNIVTWARSHGSKDLNRL